MNFELTGKIVAIYGVMQVSDRFIKRDFVVECGVEKDDRFIYNPIRFQLHNNNVGLVDGLKEGDEVCVSFNPKGFRQIKDGETHYFTNLICYRVKLITR